MLVFMTGMMGSGKTTVAKHLSSLLNLPFEDLDHVLEDREGCTISDLFRTQGEAYFRAREREILTEYCGKTEGIFSLGGGALCSPESWDLIPGTAKVIWLKATVETLLARLREDDSRPLLQNNQREELMSLTQNRAAFYARAHIHLDTDRKSPADLAQDLYIRLGVTSS